MNNTITLKGVMMKKFMILFVSVAVAMSNIGCASIINGKRQNINFKSSPDGATVEVYNSYGENVASATTPATIRFKRGAGYLRRANFVVHISKDGYETQTINIRSRFNKWSFYGSIPLSIFYGIPIIVDSITGAMWTLKPESIDANLRQSISFDDSASDDGIYIVLKEQIPEDVFAKLDLVPIE